MHLKQRNRCEFALWLLLSFLRMDLLRVWRPRWLPIGRLIDCEKRFSFSTVHPAAAATAALPPASITLSPASITLAAAPVPVALSPASITLAAAPVPVALPPASITLAAAPVLAATLDPARVQLRRGLRRRHIRDSRRDLL
jgi:hypothetical protein